MAAKEEAGDQFSLKTFIQQLLVECRPEFDAEEDVGQRLRIVCSKPGSEAVAAVVHREDAWPRKNEELSRRNREDGNQAYQEGRYDLAVLLYTEAMRYAPTNPALQEGEALAMAAANRSAAFYQQKQHREAIEDVEVAVAAGYPRNSVYKLYIRKCKCELELGRINKAQAAFDAAVEAIEWSGLKKDVRSDLTVNLQEAFINLAKTASDEGYKEEVTAADLAGAEREAADIPASLALASHHPRLPAASEAVRVVHEAGVGRHVVASRDILPGEVLFTEAPLVSCQLDDHVEAVCEVCLRYTAAPIPCPTCSDVNFCSLACRTHALQTFHKYECKLTHVFQETGIKQLPLLLLSFRAVTQRPVEFFLKHRARLTEHDTMFGAELAEGEQYVNTDYATLYNLCTHNHRRDTNDIYSKTIFAAFLLRCLQEVGYFKTVTQEPAGATLTEAEVLVGRLIKHFLDCIQFNTHTVESIYENRVVAWDAETRLWKNCARINVGDSVETVRIGGAVYPTLALVNHSCDPNIVIVFWGRTAVAVASRCINEGDEINDNYGAYYGSMEAAERRRYLERSHWFTCACAACTHNFPEYIRCAKDFKKLPGSAFKYKRCDRQKLNRDVETIKKDIKVCVSKGEHERMYEMYLKWSELLDKLVIPPHQDFINIRKGIRSCIFKLSPNKARAREEED